MMINPHVPAEAEILERIQESPTIFTLRLRFTDAEFREHYRFQPGQFNMVYLHGVGEVAISIVSDPHDYTVLNHTIRAVGRVTHGLSQLNSGDYLGIRGPYGRAWPLTAAAGKDVVVMTGGLGCAPVVGVIHYIVQRRAQFGRLVIIQGVKHSADLIWRRRYEAWAQLPNTQVLLAADAAGPGWPWHVGRVTQLLDQASFDKEQCTIMMCGPEIMMHNTAHSLLTRGVAEHDIWLSMERNMQCAIGLCGHCQYGDKFVCKNGPIFSWPEVKTLFGIKGF